MSWSSVLVRIRAAFWALQALRAARRALARRQVRDIDLPAPPRLPASAVGGIDALLRRQHATCLECALVRQRWLAAHGEPRTIAIGVTAPSHGFTAHAWLVGEEDAEAGVFHELTRIEP